MSQNQQCSRKVCILFSAFPHLCDVKSKDRNLRSERSFHWFIFVPPLHSLLLVDSFNGGAIVLNKTHNVLGLQTSSSSVTFQRVKMTEKCHLNLHNVVVLSYVCLSSNKMGNELK
jgi:hypothetical protein